MTIQEELDLKDEQIKERDRLLKEIDELKKENKEILDRLVREGRISKEDADSFQERHRKIFKNE